MFSFIFRSQSSINSNARIKQICDDRDTDDGDVYCVRTRDDSNNIVTISENHTVVTASPIYSS